MSESVKTRRPLRAGTKAKGMTLVEVLVAIVIFSGALLAMGVFSGRFAKAVSEQKNRSIIAQLAADRLETVKAAGRYATIDSLYKGTENPIAGYPGFKRETQVKRIGGGAADLEDYKIVTVIVTSPVLQKPLARSTVIAAF